MFKLRTLALFTAFSCLTFGLSAQEQNERSESSFNLDSKNISKISEAFGHLIGSNLNNPGIAFDVESLIRGINNSQIGKPSPMSTQEYEEAMNQIQEIAFNEMAKTNLEKAERFLETNRSNENIMELVGGKVQYEILQEGNGNTVSENGAPTIHYTGTYLDGSIFGSSESSGGAITLPLDQTISGFGKAIVGMKEGEKRRIFIHPEEGYGAFGHLEPNALLTFEIEIVNSDSENVTASITRENESETAESETTENDEIASNENSSENTSTGVSSADWTAWQEEINSSSEATR